MYKLTFVLQCSVVLDYFCRRFLCILYNCDIQNHHFFIFIFFRLVSNTYANQGCSIKLIRISVDIICILHNYIINDWKYM